MALWLFFTSQLYRHRKSTPVETGLPLVSVIVANKNNAEGLKRLIPVVLKQDYPHFQMIVVDDFSTDHSLEVLQSVENTKFSYIQCSKDIPGKKQALTEAIAASRGEWILLTDADCIPASDEWISGMAHHISDKTDLVLGYSPALLDSLTNDKSKVETQFVSVFARAETWLTGVQYLSWAQAGVPYMGVGRNMMYSKAFFEKAGGFSEFFHIPAGDDDLLIAHHAKSETTAVSLDENTFVYTSPETSLKDYYNQKLRHIGVSKYYPLRAKLVNLLFSGSLLMFYFTCFAVFLFVENNTLILSWLAVFYLLLILNTIMIQKKLPGYFNCWWMPVFDFLMFYYYLVFGITFNFKKNTKWR